MRFILLLLLCLTAPASNAESFLDRLPGLGGSKQPSFLPPDKAFGLEIVVRDAHTLQASLFVS
jgi:thioredoxin:protein disulfide reductase